LTAPNNVLQAHFFAYSVATVLLVSAGLLFLMHPRLKMPVNRLTGIVLLAEAYLYCNTAQNELLCKQFWPQLNYWEKQDNQWTPQKLSTYVAIH
jgi:hypothetical protein